MTNHLTNPQPYTLKGLCIRSARLVIVLACFANVLFLLTRTRTTGQKVLAALGTASLVVVALKRDQFLPILD